MLFELVFESLTSLTTHCTDVKKSRTSNSELQVAWCHSPDCQRNGYPHPYAQVRVLTVFVFTIPALAY